MSIETKYMAHKRDGLDSYRNEGGVSPLERIIQTRWQHEDSKKLEGAEDNSITQSFECRPHGEGALEDLWQPDYEEVVYKHHLGDARLHEDETYAPQPDNHWQASPLADPEVSPPDLSAPASPNIKTVPRDEAESSPPLQDGEGLRNMYGRLSLLDRHLSVWIMVVMAIALLVGYYHSGLKERLEVANISSVSLPVAVGLWVMLYPVLCKIRYELLGQMFMEGQLGSNLLLSFILSWLVGPALMTALAWATLPDLPTYRTGVILIGIARCIAMVMIWNDLAKGDAELCAVLVAFNSILQILLFSPLTLFYLRVVSGGEGADVSVRTVTESVFLFLGIPFAAGVATRLLLRSAKGPKWYDTRFIPFIAPWALLGLLYTIFIMFSVQAHGIIYGIGSVCRVVVPLLQHAAG